MQEVKPLKDLEAPTLQELQLHLAEPAQVPRPEQRRHPAQVRASGGMSSGDSGAKTNMSFLVVKTLKEMLDIQELKCPSLVN